MTTDQINYLNIGLIFLALILAFQLPFELFMLSYAVLGPLHYLTEIAWLKKHNFFTEGRHDWLILTSLCIFYLLIYMLVEFSSWESMHGYYSLFLGPDFGGRIAFLTSIETHFIFVAFAISLGMVVLKNPVVKAILGVVCLVLAFQFADWSFYAIAFGLFLPTLIHVSLFTGAFMLYGTLKSNSMTGLITFGIFVVAGVICFTAKIDQTHQISETTYSSYLSTGFHYLNLEIIGFTATPLAGGLAQAEAIFKSDIGLAVQRFIAFSYTYHYFNWFSKTTVIKWHKVPARWLITVVTIWVSSLALYWYSYKVGLLALLFLSTLHVFLEFPLNHRSFIGIGQELGTRLGLRQKE